MGKKKRKISETCDKAIQGPEDKKEKRKKKFGKPFKSAPSSRSKKILDIDIGCQNKLSKGYPKLMLSYLSLFVI